MLPFLLAAVIAAGPAIDDRPMDDKSVKHTLTGTAIGGALMGSCVSVFNLKDRANGASPRLSSLSCLGITVGASSLAYGYKEGIYDPAHYHDGDITPKGRRDFVEGVGGAATGAAIFVPVAEW